jgi:hypothetical protein
MARYSAFLGRDVEVCYRAGDICLPAAGKFVGDSGRSIFLEQHYEQRGQLKNFRWEIPYQFIVRLEEQEASTAGNSPRAEVTTGNPAADSEPLQATAACAGAGGSAQPISTRPKSA